MQDDAGVSAAPVTLVSSEDRSREFEDDRYLPQPELQLSAANTYKLKETFEQLGGVTEGVDWENPRDRGDLKGHWTFPSAQIRQQAYTAMKQLEALPKQRIKCRTCGEFVEVMLYDKGYRPNGRSAECKQCKSNHRKNREQSTVAPTAVPMAKRAEAEQLEIAIRAQDAAIEEQQAVVDALYVSRSVLADRLARLQKE